MYEASFPPLLLKVAPQKEKTRCHRRLYEHGSCHDRDHVTTRLGPDWLHLIGLSNHPSVQRVTSCDT